MTKTKIEWTNETWNPLRGCSRVSEGCRNCYAEKVAYRFKGPGQPYEGLIARGGQWNGEIKLVPEKLTEPLRWRKPRMIFVNSMSDLFHENVPFEFIDKVFAIMAQCPEHTFQVLTKRPHRMLAYLTSDDRARKINQYLSSNFNCSLPLPNVWLGVSIEDQHTAIERMPYLLDTPAAVRWLSIEPLLDQINFYACSEYWFFELDYKPWRNAPILHGIDWIVVGGESGPNARPMDLPWARMIRDQCQESGTPFFFKQWGEYAPNWYTNDEGEYDGGPIWMDRMGKKAAGRLLDGVEWSEYPRARQ